MRTDHTPSPRRTPQRRSIPWSRPLSAAARNQFRASSIQLRLDPFQGWNIPGQGRAGTPLSGKVTTGRIGSRRLVSSPGMMEEVSAVVHHRGRSADVGSIINDPRQLDHFAQVLQAELGRTARGWRRSAGEVYRDMVCTYGRAVMRWAGIVDSDKTLDHWSLRLVQSGNDDVTDWLEHAHALLRRIQCGHWAGELVTQTRMGRRIPPHGTTLSILAWTRNEHDKKLSSHAAGTALRDCIGPVIGAARLADMAARDLAHHPELLEPLRDEVRHSHTLMNNPIAMGLAHRTWDRAITTPGSQAHREDRGNHHDGIGIQTHSGTAQHPGQPHPLALVALAATISALSSPRIRIEPSPTSTTVTPARPHISTPATPPGHTAPEQGLA